MARKKAIKNAEPAASASGELDEFHTMELVNGLHGVCEALDQLAVDGAGRDTSLIADLSMAAKVLSRMMQMREARHG